MKIETIKKYLRPQKISGRMSTFNNAFASALAPHDIYDRKTVSDAVRQLGQDPDGELFCVYCDTSAATWDHLRNRVEAGQYSGYGHHVRNLVPCCRTCNEKKGGKPWQEWIDKLGPANALDRKARIQAYISEGTVERLGIVELETLAADEIARYRDIQEQVRALLIEADSVAKNIRDKVGVRK